MFKPRIPAALPVSPITLTCPRCGAKPNYDCIGDAGGFSAIHLARIEAAAAQDVVNRKAKSR
jgi:hypothetical protein